MSMQAYAMTEASHQMHLQPSHREGMGLCTSQLIFAPDASLKSRPCALSSITLATSTSILACWTAAISQMAVRLTCCLLDDVVLSYRYCGAVPRAA